MISKLQEKMNSYQRVWAEIDLDAIWENMIHMKENIAPETKILAVIKTDGYGHGGVPIARMLEDVDFMFGYAAATYEEAHVLREASVKKPILILGYTFPYCYEEMIREEIRPAVYPGIPWKNWQRPQQRPVRKPKCISKWIPAWEGSVSLRMTKGWIL